MLPVGAFVDKAAMNIVYRLLFKYVFISLGYMPRGTIAESYGNCIGTGPVKYDRVNHSHGYIMSCGEGERILLI